MVAKILTNILQIKKITSSQVLWCVCMHVCRHTPTYAFLDLENYKNKTKILNVIGFFLGNSPASEF